MKGQRILVVGGRGFVGSHVVRALMGQGSVPVLFGPAMAHEPVDGPAWVEGSVTSRADLARAFSSGIDAVVSCAAHGGRLGLMRSGEADVDAALDVNVVGFGKLMDEARAAGVRRVVWTSSTVVYGPSETYARQPVHEDDTVCPVTQYGLTKVLAEEVARYHRHRYGMEVCGLRLPLVLGTGLWYEGAAAGLAALFRAEGTFILEAHDEPMDLIHATDVGGAVLAVLAHSGPLRDCYNLEGFRVRASELVDAVRVRRPGVGYRAVAPGLLFPLISGERLRADTGFVPALCLPAFVDAMLEDP